MSLINIKIAVNGITYSIQIDSQESLMNVLRERLKLTGTKNGCDSGHCGTCTVIMNEKTVKSCLIRGKKMNNASVVTIEGISNNYQLHPIQEAFIKTAGVQCGFCTPGYIMKLYGLYHKNLYATETEIYKALENHLCRCTGYKPILEAAKLAQKQLIDLKLSE